MKVRLDSRGHVAELAKTMPVAAAAGVSVAAAAVCEMRAGSSHRIGILFGGCSADRPLIAWRRLNLTETTHIRREQE